MNQYTINKTGVFTFSTDFKLGSQYNVIKHQDEEPNGKYLEFITILSTLLTEGWTASFKSKSKMSTVIDDSFLSDTVINLFDLQNEIVGISVENGTLLIKAKPGVFIADLDDIEALHITAIATIYKPMGMVAIGALSFIRVDKDTFKFEVHISDPSILSDLLDIKYDEKDIPLKARPLSILSHLVMDEHQLARLLWEEGLRYKGTKGHKVHGYHQYPALVSVDKEGFSMESLQILNKRAEVLENDHHGVSKEDDGQGSSHSEQLQDK